jgi:SSS family transporter
MQVKWMETMITLSYIIACIGIGLWAMKKVSTSSDDYWVAGRKIGTFVNSWATMSALASGGSVLGVMGLAYAMGIPYTFAMFAGAATGFPLAAILVARPLRNMKLKTVPQFLSIRYNNKIIDIIVPLIVLIGMEVYIVAQLKAAGVTAQYLLGIPYEWSVVITALVFTLYVSIGGMWAVTMTDVLQGILMVGMVLIVAVIIFFDFGGMFAVAAKGTALMPKLGEVSTRLGPSSYAGAFLVWLIGASTLPHLVMRVFTARDANSAKLSLNYSVIIYAFMIVFGVVAISSAGHVLFPNLKDADTLFLKIIDHYIPSPIINGLACAAIMAAVMSTTDALILAVAGAAVNDIFVKHINPAASDATVFKLSLVVTWIAGLLAIVFALNPPALLTMLYTAAVGLLGSCLFAPILMGIWWKKTTTQGALWSIIIGGGSYLYMLWGMKMPALTQILYSLPIAFLVIIVVSLMTQPADQKVVAYIGEIHKAETE